MTKLYTEKAKTLVSLKKYAEAIDCYYQASTSYPELKRIFLTAASLLSEKYGVVKNNELIDLEKKTISGSGFQNHLKSLAFVEPITVRDINFHRYVIDNPDVASSNSSPDRHYFNHGIFEGRKVFLNSLNCHARITFPGMDLAKLTLDRLYKEKKSQEESCFLSRLKIDQKNNEFRISKIKASIVMPAFNRSFCIEKAIESVIKQWHKNWELLVIDDGGSDETFSILEKYFGKINIRYFRADRAGVSSARNVGLNNLTGDAVFFLDTDNTWREDYLSSMLTFMFGYNIDAAYCGSAIRTTDGDPCLYRGDDFFWSLCLKSNYIDMNCFGLKRRALIDSKCCFDESIRRLVDWDFILNVTKSVRTCYAPFYGVNYFDGDDEGRITRSEYGAGSELSEIVERIRVKHKNDYLVKEDRDLVWWKILRDSEAVFEGDHISEKFEKFNEQDIDWVKLEQRREYSHEVSIIIVCYNKSDLTKDCLNSLVEHTDLEAGAVEILVVDNGCQDDTKEVISYYSEKYDCIKGVSCPENLMFSVGNNYGFSKSGGRFVIFLNNDTQVTQGWLEPLLQPLKEHSQIGAVGPKLLYGDNTIQCAGIVFGPLSKMPYHIYRGFHRDAPCVNKKRFYPSLTGACIAVRASEFSQVHGFDPVYINGCEDVDLCLKYSSGLNLKLLYTPQSEVYHLEGKSEGRGKYIARNRAILNAVWGELITPTDYLYYKVDGFALRSYVKPGSEVHGETAAYAPVFSEEGEQELKFSAGSLNVGFCSIWHERGITIHTHQLAEALETDFSIKTHIFARWESDKFSNRGGVYHPRVMNGGDDPTEEEIVAWARSNELAAVIFMEVHPKDWKRVRALQDIGVKVICYENLDILRTELWDRYGVFDAFLFNAFYSRSVFKEKFPEIPAFMIPWGKTMPPPRVEKQNETGGGLITFTHVAGWGGLNNRKNSDLVLRAFSRVSAKNARLKFYTQSPVSNYGEEAEKLVKTDSRISVIEGTIENIQEAYEGVDVLLWPSKREGVGLPIIEALSSGVPVIASDGYMMKQWFVPGEHGLLCRAVPDQGPMFLPEMRVDEENFISLIQKVCSDGGLLQKLKRNVNRDRHLWQWDWQKSVMAAELKKYLLLESYSPSEDLCYLPSQALTFSKL